MFIDATYQRTFLRDGPIEPATCHFGCHRNDNPTSRSGMVGSPEFIHIQPQSGGQSFGPDGPFRTADMTTPPRRVHYRTQKRRPAFMIVGNSIEPTFIVDKLDQTFSEVATPWEKEYSALVKDGPDRFVPLVDHTCTVVGHVGTVRGTRLIKVKDSPISSFDYGSIAEYVAAEEVVLVSKTVPDGWEVFNYLQPNPIYTVVTDIFGDVQSGDITDSMPGIITTTGPIELILDAADLIMLATGVLGIGKALLTGLVKTISRRKFVSMVISRTKDVLGRTVQQVVARRAARKAAVRGERRQGYLEGSRRYYPGAPRRVHPGGSEGEPDHRRPAHEPEVDPADREGLPRQAEEPGVHQHQPGVGHRHGQLGPGGVEGPEARVLRRQR